MAHYLAAQQALTSNGGATGVLAVADSSGFRIGAIISVADTAGTQGVAARVKDIPDGQHIYAVVLDTSKCADPYEAPVLVASGGTTGLNAAGHVPSLDFSAFTTAHSSFITQAEQDVTFPDRIVRSVGGIDAQGRPTTLMLGQNGGIGRWRIDFASAGVKLISTSTVDANVVLPAGWYRMVVSGVPAYINSGAAATTAMVLLPVGAEDTPTWRSAQTIHAITGAGTGQVAFIPATPL